MDDRANAAKQLVAALTIDPDNARLHYHLRTLYLRMGKAAEAQRELHDYIRLSAPWALRYEAAPTPDSQDN
jgi:predicted Zn-dependent protease